MREIQLYSYESCPYCKKTKAYLAQKQIDYTNFDVHKDDSKAKELIDLTGQGAVPALVVRDGDRENIVIGYEPTEIDKALKKNS